MSGGLGWDADGMCDDHGRFACETCALPRTQPPSQSYAEGVEDAETLERRVRIAAWNAAKKSGASDVLGYAVVEAVAAEFAALSQGGKA